MKDSVCKGWMSDLEEGDVDWPFVLDDGDRVPFVVGREDGGHRTKFPLSGSREKTSPVAPPAEYTATSLAQTYPLRDLVWAVPSRDICVEEWTA